ncbi:MAG: hypothetical protein LHV68_08400 [Elusimicrobia bacterium]|nr:hypothetical protein [Candidatus Liberimonas magnetica]
MKNNKYIAAVFCLIAAVSLCLAVVSVSERYKVLLGQVTGGNGSPSSKNYSVSVGVLGQAIFSEVIPKSSNYSVQSGDIIVQNTINTNAASPNLETAFVYPNPIKPNSPGSPYYAQGLTFKALTPAAIIKVFNMAGELVAALNKTDVSVDFYAWDMRNDNGEKLASGIYIFFTTNPANGETKKGKFAIIK